jgi:hypothetical protein
MSFRPRPTGVRPAALALLAGAAGAQGVVPLLAEDRMRMPAGLPAAVEVLRADFDGDGLPDLARVADESVVILLQDAGGRFAVRQNLRVPGAAFLGGSVARVRPNGTLPDLMLVRATSAPFALVNSGNGTFAPAALTLPTPPTPVVAALIGDLDRQPPDDILVLPSQGRPQLLLGQLAGYRDASQLLATGVFVQSPVGALFDLEGDGDLDVVIASATGGTPYLLENTGSFMRQTTLPLLGAFSALAAGDFDGDGRADLAFARTAPLPLAVEFLLQRAGSFVRYVPPTPMPLDAAAARLRAVDVQADRALDLVVLQADGRGRVGLSDGQPAFTLTYGVMPLAPARRQGLAVGDLDRDGDVDMVAGGVTVRDAVLLCDPRAPSWVDTEAAGFPPGGLRTPGAGAAVDVNGDAELDVVVCAPAGNDVVFHNDGAARFAERAAIVPALPVRDVRRVLRASVDTQDRDLVVVASAAGGSSQPPGVRVLVNQAGRYADVTGARLPPLVQRGFAEVTVARVVLLAGGTRRVDDLLLADTAGNLHALLNQAGTFVEAAGAFAPSAANGAVRALLTGDVDGDQRSDVVLVVHGTGGDTLQVYLRTATNTPPLFVAITPPALAVGTVTQAILADLDGDRNLDLVAAQAAGSPSPLVFLAGNGAGDFRDVTATMLPGPLPTDIEALAVLTRSTAGAALLVGRGAGQPLLVLRRVRGVYIGEDQAMHGAAGTAGFVVADFDADGDDDCAVLAQSAHPTLLLGTAVHLAGPVAQAGRVIALRARAPDPQAIAAWLWSPVGPARLPFAGLGIIRLAPPVHSLAVFPIGPALALDLEFSAPPLPADSMLFFQLAVFDPTAAALRLSNLHALQLLAR